MFFTNQIKKFFQFDKLQATINKEIIGGITTFLAMVYILSVQPSMLSKAPSINPNNPNMGFGGIFIATVITAFISTLIMGLSANIPAGLAPGMGLNAVFTYNVASNGLGYEGALIAVMLSSIIFCLISATKLRMLIISNIPKSIKTTISVGIGFFIAYIGLVNIGLIATSNGLPVAKISNLKTNWPIILMGLFVLTLIFILYFKKIPGAIAIAIVIGLIVSLIIGNTINNDFIKSNFAHWTGWKYSDFSQFKFNLKHTYQAFGNAKIWTSPTMYIAIFIFLFVSFFDATGTLTTMNQQINNSLKQKVELKSNALLADSLGSLTGSVLGSSPVVTFAESTTGIAQGAKTGFASVITAFMFLIALIFYPIFKLITPCIFGAATIFVGTLMILHLKDIEWKIPEVSISSFFIILIIITTYSITNGIAFGFLTYTLISIITKKNSQINWLILILDLFFILYFISYAFIQ